MKTKVITRAGIVTTAVFLFLIGCGTDLGTMKDNDGNVYKTVKIGNQIWMAENLRTTTFNDGTPIPRVTSKREWGKLYTPGYCYYNNSTDVEYQKKWGALYDWYAVNTGKIVPEGWRVPTGSDWTELEEYLIANGYNWDGTTSGNKVGKSLAAKTDWHTSSTEGDVGNDISSNNSTGFSALPGGCRLPNGNFNTQSDNGGWWSATESHASLAWGRYLGCYYERLDRNDIKKRFGLSLRLVRDLD